MTRAKLPARSVAGRFLKARWAPYLALGPVSGPLTAGVVLNVRDGHLVLASLYGLALVLWFTETPLWIAHMLPASLAHLF